MNPQLIHDLEKHHPAAFKRLKQYKYQFLYTMIKENLERGIKEDLYRTDSNATLPSATGSNRLLCHLTRKHFPTINIR